MKKSIKLTLKNLLFFLFLMILTLWVIFKDQSITHIFSVIKNANGLFILVGILCMFLYMSFEALNVGRTTKALNEKSNFFKNLKYVLIGFFFSSITPAASGGEPMQIYYMHRDGISVSSATLSCLLSLMSMQIITISFAFIGFFINYRYLNTPLIIFFVIGISLNLMALTLLFVGIFSKKLTNWLVKIAIKFMKFLRIKNVSEKAEKIERELTKYQDSAVYLKEHKMIILKTILTTGIKFLLLYSISYFVYRALGFNAKNIIEIIFMQALVYGTVSGIPSPGAVGVSEGAFIAIFSHVYPKNLINSATLLSRGINFYLFVIVSGIVVVINDIRKNSKKLNDSE